MKRDTVFRMAIALFVVIGMLVGTTALSVSKATAAEQETIQGVVAENKKGTTVIKLDDGQVFNVLGQNMKDMIGKTVKVTGTLSKGKTSRAVVVTSFEEVPN